MALVAFTSTITAATLRANFDDARAQLLANSTVGAKDYEIALMKPIFQIGATTMSWTQIDDAEVRGIYLNKLASAGTVVGALTQTQGDTDFLLNTTQQISGAAAASRTYTDLRTTTGTRIRLKKGAQYSLTVTTSVASTFATFGVQLRTLPRIA